MEITDYNEYAYVIERASYYDRKKEVCIKTRKRHRLRKENQPCMKHSY